MNLINVELQTRIRSHLLDVQLSIGNELLALLGRDGAGKTEILRSIAGVYSPESGAIDIQGRTVFNPALAINVPSAMRHVGSVPRSSALFPSQTVAENIRFPFRRGYPLSEHESERRIDEILELLRLSEHRNRLVRDLDDREKFWVALGRTLVIDPELLLLDQPFAGLEVTLQRKLRHDLQRIRRDIRVPAVVATSDLEDAYEIADRIALIDAGRILQIDPPRKLVTRPSNRAVAELVRSVNLFPVTILDVDDDGTTVTSDLGTLHVAELRPSLSEMEAVIRPEHIRVLVDHEEMRTLENVISGTVLESTSYDALVAMMFHPDGAPSSRVLEISVSEPFYRQLPLGPGERCSVVLPPHALHLMELPVEELVQEEDWAHEGLDAEDNQEQLDWSQEIDPTLQSS